MRPVRERRRLRQIAVKSAYGHGLDAHTARYSFSIFKRFLRPGSVLEMGPADGIMTAYLEQWSQELTVIDGAKAFCIQLRRNYPHIHVVHALFEEYRPDQTFENIILGHVLEHVEDPTSILRKVKGWLSPKGRVFAAVPNARSIHRQAAAIMGLLKSERDLSENDLCHGHRRVYDPESFRSDFISSGLTIEVFGGYWIKPYSNIQIEKTWTPEMIEAFMALGERYPDIAAELYIVATK